METLQGTVKRVRHTTHVSGGRSSTSTEHIALFEIGGVLVTFRSVEPVPIERDDEVRVIGYEEVGRTMDAVAYHNLTRDVVEDALPRGGCVADLVIWPGVILVFGSPILIGLFLTASPIAWIRANVPWWTLLIPPLLLWLAIIRDRRRNAERERMLALLYA